MCFSNMLNKINKLVSYSEINMNNQGNVLYTVVTQNIFVLLIILRMGNWCRTFSSATRTKFNVQRKFLLAVTMINIESIT